MRLLSPALTVILLAASGVLLYSRFHHTPFHVTGAVISPGTRPACGLDATGRITTNGAAGTVSWVWLIQPVQPGEKLPRPRSQSINAGQHALPVVLYLPARGRGTASELVTLQVLGPDPRTASATVVVSC